ncbi:sulfite exporter TauE/SafE family protein [Benzoatithermus flavus]|uniref:Probable membrane transporter protein n=1 Tax=Benzoatithermus flavus TaxID=3108223 RepID=A0ABU8XUF8_9PROT
MDIYLPVAEMSVNLFWVLGLGGVIGFLSGLFGVGGGFLLTPMLILMGIPPAVAVGSQAAQILASSVSGVLANLRRRAVDFRMGWVLVAGGTIGSAAGVGLFNLLMRLGQIDAFVSIAYVLFLGIVGTLMFAESLSVILHSRRPTPRRRRLHQHNWMHGLPFKMRFPESRLYISALMPLLVGAFGGLLAAILGIGGGFVMVPAMIYLIGMPTAVVIGTSLFQICFVAAITGFLHAYNNHSVDILLALLLIAGGVVGVQFGSRFGGRLKAEHTRILLALLVLLVCAKLAYDLIVPPRDLYSITVT